jgi:hypothetical protein
MSWIKKTLTLFYIVAISVALLVLIDFCIGSPLIPCSEVAHLGLSRCKNTNANRNTIRVQHPVYHHDLKKMEEKRVNGEGRRMSCVRMEMVSKFRAIPVIKA